MATNSQELDVPRTPVGTVARDAVNKFLERMSLTVPERLPRNADLESRVKAVAQTWPFGDRIRDHIITGTVLAQTSYSHLNIEAQAMVALYTSLMTYIDDPGVFHATGARDFPQMMCNGAFHCDQGPLGQLASTLTDMGRHFPSFGTNMILSGTMRWFCGEMVCNTAEPSFLIPQSKAFVDYCRYMSGASEAFAAFIWDKANFLDESSYIHVFPDVRIYLDHGNDILSFYKEELERDTSSYIYARSRIMNKTPCETLFELIDEVVAAVERIREHLGECPMRDAWNVFETGYTLFHIGSPRYRLKEVIFTEYMMDTTTY
ncbi:terpenoid synthase [Daedalea quercina L-15889]|uniref:Terpenoid synthase n=1 Tax=Daedalea quercina L-15889 TaxID=1314783 RepID=A0A165TG65_9APHY|nr:terpenoid synthase [Daedalea quercina L-15889]